MERFRREIDVIDDKIADLFTKRLDLARQIGKEKQKQAKNINDTNREEAIVAKLAKAFPEDKDSLSRLYQSIFAISKELQRDLTGPCDYEDYLLKSLTNTDFPSTVKAKVGVQGSEGSYGYLAAKEIFANPSINYYESFEDIFASVNKGECEFGVLPIENSIYGEVNEVYDLLDKNNSYIVADFKLEINHYLLGKESSKISDIKEVISHYQALGQCRDYLSKLPNIKITSSQNTALAAKYLAHSERDDLATISSKECADLYGLKILDENIQNNEINYTRFIVIKKDMEVYKDARIISIILELANKPGALFDLIGKFAALGLNLIRIESRPIAGSKFDFRFYLNFEGTIKDQKTRKLLSELNNSNEYFAFLGNYVEV
ncbi:MAG: chorismate mutase [Anaerococcus sp.]|nr:chorismate mutase [Anaerococcus sp.]